MPELPEVHTITTDIEGFVSNSLIEGVKIESGYRVSPSNDHLSSLGEDARLLGVERVAKNIILKTSEETFIQIHLAMTGRLLLRKVGRPKDKYQKLALKLSKKGKSLELRFCDMRMFGKVVVLDKQGFLNLKEKYGPEPIDPLVTAEKFYEAIQKRNTKIKNALLDQSVIAGLGNVYAIDALWIAQIHPETKTKAIDEKQAESLLKASREILNEGIKNRGITIDSFVDAFGKPGNQQNFFRVYRQEECKRCGSNIEFKKLNGRGTYFCPICQPKDNQKRLL